jgi:hypothetical protein
MKAAGTTRRLTTREILVAISGIRTKRRKFLVLDFHGTLCYWLMILAIA